MNDVSTTCTTAEALIDKYKSLLKVVRQLNDRAVIGVSSILPRPCDSQEINEKIIAVNKELKLLCKQTLNHFIPSYRPFVKKGKEIKVDLQLNEKMPELESRLKDQIN